jgi:hypothetical protein
MKSPGRATRVANSMSWGSIRSGFPIDGQCDLAVRCPPGLGRTCSSSHEVHDAILLKATRYQSVERDLGRAGIGSTHNERGRAQDDWTVLSPSRATLILNAWGRGKALKSLILADFVSGQVIAS